MDTVKPPCQAQRISGLLLALGVVQFLFCLVLAESLYPDYSVSRNFISDLGVGPVAYIFNSSVIVFGLLILASASQIWSFSKDRLLLVSMCLAGLGAIGVGLFPETAGPIHVAVSFVTFFFGGISAILSIRLHPGQAGSILCVLLGIISLTAMLLFVTYNDMGLGPGGMERMIAYPLFVWAIWMGGNLMGKAEEAGAR